MIDGKVPISTKLTTRYCLLLEKPGIIPKMSQPRNGPYEVIEVFTNGTIMIRKGAVTHRVNIRRVTPYFT